MQEGRLGLGDVCLLRALGLDVPSLGFTKATGEHVLAGGPPSRLQQGPLPNFVEVPCGYQRLWTPL